VKTSIDKLVAASAEVHKANAMRKIGLSGRIDLLQYALHQGWLHDS